MANGNFIGNLNNYIGQTVTVFTTSGGQSGLGFTGVLVAVNPAYIRLIDQIGSAPGCALGNCCPGGGLGNVGRGPGNVAGVNDTVCADGYNDNYGNVGNNVDNLNNMNTGNYGNDGNYGNNGNCGNNGNVGNVGDRTGRPSCNGITLGAIVDIPVNRIASFVHNAVGSGW